jgi:addiction module HigA family antidote
MINGGFASKGQKGPLVQQMLRLLIITEETQMARTAIHPGEHLADELKELKMSAAELARQIDVPVNRVTGIINAQHSVTADTALRLVHAADAIGIRGILVHVISAEAKAFYLGLGFDLSPIEPMTLMVTLADVRNSIE